MFGYIHADLETLAEDERLRYESFYCGLCRALKSQWGTLPRLSLTYDMTFLALFLGSLYEPEETASSARCPLHPLKARPFMRTKYLDYAADMSVLLAHANCLDDWNDEKKILPGIYAKTLEGKAELVRKTYPRQAKTLKQEIDRLTILENEQCGDIDEVVSCAGAILGEIFVPHEDFWSAELRNFGTQLGKFIYLMDAACDKKQDSESGSYNPLLLLGWSDEGIRNALELLIANAAESFEKLPLEQDSHLMRSVLYSGAWQRLNQIDLDKAKEKPRRNTTHG